MRQPDSSRSPNIAGGDHAIDTPSGFVDTVFIARHPLSISGKSCLVAASSYPVTAQQQIRAAGVEPSRPWFWVMIFSAAGVLFLLAFSAKYAARQRRLEMQYYARQEITRRQVEGTTPPAGAPKARPGLRYPAS